MTMMTELKLWIAGTREGMTAVQSEALRLLLAQYLGEASVSHGDCVGADAEAHAIALEMGFPVEIRPPSQDRLRAYCQGANKVHPAKPYLDRNRDGVRAADIVIACPKELTPRSRGGTWHVVNHARLLERKTYIVYPSGKISLEEQTARISRTPGSEARP